jgi:hypothetical protein
VEKPAVCCLLVESSDRAEPVKPLTAHLQHSIALAEANKYPQNSYNRFSGKAALGGGGS